MQLPEGVTEAEFTAVATKIAKTLARRFRFGYHGVEDFEQEILVFCMQGMAGYQPSRGALPNYLFGHAKKRLINFRRDHYARCENPCAQCSHTEAEQSDCPRWREWKLRNTAKRNLMEPVNICSVSDEGERSMSTPSHVVEEAEYSEMETKLDRELPVQLRADYLRLRSGISIPQPRREAVQKAVADILNLPCPTASASARGDVTNAE